MEQFFEILKESPHYKEQLDYERDREAENNAAFAFLDEHGIEGGCYMIYKGYLWVLDCPENRDKFKGQFLVDTEQGCVAFKKNSVIGKAFKNSGIKRANSPYVPFFFSNPVGRMRTRCFSYKDKVYCSIDCNNELACPANFRKMKGSEFYAVIEEMDAELKKSEEKSEE